MPEAPSWLSLSARRIWDNIGGRLLELGLITVVDGEAFAAYCTAVSNLEEIQTALNKMTERDTGWLILSRAGNSARDQVWKGCARFGLTPADRVRLSTPNGADDPKTDILDFIAQKNGTCD
jgi:P27 family predicted phage terminase small subunit